MKERKILNRWVYVAVYTAVIVACIVADQLTKLFIFDGLLQSTERNSVQVIGDFLRFYATYNEGAIFGLFKGRAADIMFFIVTVAATPLYFYFMLRARTRSVWGQIGFAFIIGGAIGNAIDRAFICTEGTFFSGRVRDFISFSIFPPVFNVADSFLTVGVVMAVLAIAVFDPDSLVATLREEEEMKKSALQAANDGSRDTTQKDNCTDGNGAVDGGSDETNTVAEVGDADKIKRCDNDFAEQKSGADSNSDAVTNNVEADDLHVDDNGKTPADGGKK